MRRRIIIEDDYDAEYRFDREPIRLDGQRPSGRLRPSRIHETMRLQVHREAPGRLDAEVQDWLRRTYAENT